MRQTNIRPRRWTEQQLRDVTKRSRSIRQIITSLGLIPAGGNYSQIQKYFKIYNINTAHLKGSAWNRGLQGVGTPRRELNEILVKNSTFQSYKLKKRLFAAGIKHQSCEKCRWAEHTPDGRLPLELDHINGDPRDNRIKNLRILCPNCHALQPTHRGRNQKQHKARVVNW